MNILAFNIDARKAYRRESDREAGTGLAEILERVRRYVCAVPLEPADPLSEIERLRSALLNEYREVELLLSDVAEMRALEPARSRR